MSVSVIQPCAYLLKIAPKPSARQSGCRWQGRTRIPSPHLSLLSQAQFAIMNVGNDGLPQIVLPSAFQTSTKAAFHLPQNFFTQRKTSRYRPQPFAPFLFGQSTAAQTFWNCHCVDTLRHLHTIAHVTSFELGQFYLPGLMPSSLEIKVWHTKLQPI